MDDFAAQLKSSLHALANSSNSVGYSYPSSDEEEDEFNQEEEEDAKRWASKFKEFNKMTATEIISTLNDFRSHFTSHTNFWLKSFIEFDGVKTILHDMEELYEGSLISDKAENLKVQAELFKSLKLISDTKLGMKSLASESAVKQLSLGILVNNFDVPLATAEILTLLCLSPAGHRFVLDSLTYLQESGKEVERFLTIIKLLESSKSAEAQSVYLALLNTLINSSPKIDDRLALRREFQVLGLNDVVQKIKETTTDYESESARELAMQVYVYEEESTLDYRARTNSLA